MRAQFAHINAWVFDLDNTLYAYRDDRWTHVEKEMTKVISRKLRMPMHDARKLQKSYLERYGLTAIGMAREHGMDAAEFMAETHDHLPIKHLEPRPGLREALAALPGRRFIHTNAHQTHARRALALLEIADLFDGIYSFEMLECIPKPEPRAFELVAQKAGFDPARAAMFEDAARNLRAPKAMGMRTVLTPTGCDWASLGAEGDHIDHRAPDIVEFLRAAA